MSVSTNELAKAIEEAKRRSKRRNFKQSIELIVKLRGLDLKRPENRLTTAVYLPYVPEDKLAKICVFATGDLALRAKEVGTDAVLSKEDLMELAEDRKKSRKIAKTYDFILAQPDLMPLVGRVLGPFLGRRGKIPVVLPPNVDVKATIERYRKSIMIRIRDQPQLMCWIGVENQPVEEVVENARRVLTVVEDKYGVMNIEKVYVKLTMGPAIRVR